jgi:hypothetical protein
MPGPRHIDPEAFDDTELGAEVRAAFADGVKLIVLIPIACPACLQPVNACICRAAA